MRLLEGAVAHILARAEFHSGQAVALGVLQLDLRRAHVHLVTLDRDILLFRPVDAILQGPGVGRFLDGSCANLCMDAARDQQATCQYDITD